MNEEISSIIGSRILFSFSRHREAKNNSYYRNRDHSREERENGKDGEGEERTSQKDHEGHGSCCSSRKVIAEDRLFVEKTSRVIDWSSFF